MLTFFVVYLFVSRRAELVEHQSSQAEKVGLQTEE
jgi:hypothetical protein